MSRKAIRWATTSLTACWLVACGVSPEEPQGGAGGGAAGASGQIGVAGDAGHATNHAGTAGATPDSGGTGGTAPDTGGGGSSGSSAASGTCDSGAGGGGGTAGSVEGGGTSENGGGTAGSVAGGGTAGSVAGGGTSGSGDGTAGSVAGGGTSENGGGTAGSVAGGGTSGGAGTAGSSAGGSTSGGAGAAGSSVGGGGSSSGGTSSAGSSPTGGAGVSSGGSAGSSGGPGETCSPPFGFCSAGKVCTPSGQCLPKLCEPMHGHPINCVPNFPCHVGGCSLAYEPCVDLSSILGFAPDGTPCGNTPGMTCQHGDCLTAQCAPGIYCDPSCTTSSGGMQPDGTLCNTGSVCVGGRCKTQLAATAVPFVLATNLSISATLATFTNTLNGEPSSAFTATVDWGDGTSSAGVVSGVAGYYGVSGSHTYSSHDIVRVTVGINDTITTNQVSASFLAGYTLNEYPVQNPVGITLDTLNWPWVTQQSSQLAQLSYQGVPKEFAAPPGSAIAPTINIGLWYVEPTKIAFVTSDEDLNGGPTALVIQEFPLPGSGRTASNITADFAAMDAWFTETDRIARITQAGTITEYTIPTPNSDPRGITRGDDGVLWFTEYAASKIGKFVISTGAFTEYPTPTPLSYPDGITWGPGGIWFTEAGNNAIAYINSSGVITEYPLPTAAAFPHAIVPTAFQGLWFTEPGANKIGNINNGQITEYPVPTPNSMPWDLTAGDAIWFTERSANQVGYLKVAQ